MATKGRPKKEFTREQLDETRDLLGRRVYPSRVAKELRGRFPGLTLPMSYRLIEEAQREVFESLRGDGKAGDPLTAQYAFLMSVIASGTAKDRDRIAASAVVIKLLGLNKLIDAMGAGDAEDLLAAMVARRAERLAGREGGG